MDFCLDVKKKIIKFIYIYKIYIFVYLLSIVWLLLDILMLIRVELIT